MKKNVSLGIGLCMLAMGCSNSLKYIDISKYNLKPNALKDGEKIKIIAGAIGNIPNSREQYYNVLVGVSQLSGDTVNILVDFDPAIRESDTSKVYNYIAPSNPVYGVMTFSEDRINETYQKVIDPGSGGDVINVHNPTVIGIIGTVGSAEEKTGVN